MVRQAVDLLDHPLGRKRFDGLDNTRVQPPPPLQQETVVRDLVRQGVLEGVCRLGEQAGFIQELRRLEVRQALLEMRLRLLGQHLQEREGHVHPDHRRDLEQPFGHQGQPIHARSQHRLHRLGHRARSVWLLVCHGVPGQLLQKERIPPRLGEQRPQARLRQDRCAQHRLHHGPTVRVPQRAQGHLRPRRVRAPGQWRPRPTGPDQEERGPRQPLDQRPEPGCRRGVDPVHILHHQHQGLRLRRVHDQVPQERKGAALPRLGTEPCQTLRRHGEVQQVEQQGDVLLGGDATRVEPVLDRRHVHRGRVALSEPADLPQDVAHRQVRGRLAVGQTLSHHHGHRLARQTAAEFRHHPGLAHARLAHQAHHLALPRTHGRQAVVQQRQFPLPSHKGAAGPGTTPRDASVPPQEPLHRVYRTSGMDCPSSVRVPQGVGLHLRCTSARSRHSAGSSRGGLLLEPCRHVERRTDCRSAAAGACPSPPDHHQARVQPHAEREDAPWRAVRRRVRGRHAGAGAARRAASTARRA